MKKILLLLAAIACCVSIATAQTDSARIATLESEVKAMQTTLSDLKSEVAEVTKQNLALKQALHLQPVIAEYTNSDGISYNLVKAEGNNQTGEIIVVLSVVNNTKKDFKQYFSAYQAVGENGYAFNDEDMTEATLGKNPSPLLNKSVLLFPDTPVNFTFKFLPRSQPQYFKHLGFTSSFDTPIARFTNIPINWK